MSDTNFNSCFVDARIENGLLKFIKGDTSIFSLSITDLQNRTAINSAIFNDSTMVLTFLTQDGSVKTIQLPQTPEYNGFDEVAINNSILTFYSNGSAAGTIDLMSLINDSIGNPIISVDVDSTDIENKKLNFTTLNGGKQIINVSNLLDKDVLKGVVFNPSGMTLKFAQMDGDVATIDLTALTDLTNVTYDETNFIMKFYNKGSEFLTVDLSAINNDESLSQETDLRISGDTILSNMISSQTSLRISGDTTLSFKINDERDLRILADASLTTSIQMINMSGATILSTQLSIEHSNRISSESVISSDISTESSTRLSNDNKISADILTNINNLSTETSLRTSEINNVTSIDNSLSTSLSNEIVNRISGSTSLTSRISNEESVRISNGTSVSTRLSNDTLVRDSNDNTLSVSISNEISSRTFLTSSLSTKVSLEGSIRASADLTLFYNVSTEISDRTSTDTSLSTKISNDISLKTSTDVSLTSVISSETSLRISSDLVLSSGISTILTNNVNLPITYTSDNTQYSFDIIDGEVKIINKGVEAPHVPNLVTSGTYTGFSKTLYLPKVYINSLYCGGIDSENPDKYQSCSHNFIELSNLNNVDIALNNVALKYSISGSTWESIRLEGVIKANSTYLIRGDKCSVLEANTTIIKVDTYDMEWIDSTEKLIKFSNTKCKFLLMYESGTTIQPITEPYIQFNTTTAYCIPGYIDMVGMNVNGAVSPNAIDGYESTRFTQLVPSSRLYMKYYAMDSVSQATKAIGSRSNSVDWIWVDLTKNYQPRIENYTPKASYENKNFFFDKSILNNTKPNLINVTFGRDAHTTRCFNWISVGYYDESLYYRISGTTEWTVKESFKSTDSRNTYTNQYYNRIRVVATDNTPYTCHKMIISGLTQNTYEYKCGRDGYISDINTFKVVSGTTNDFSFIHLGDQQGFNWSEYQAWKKAADFIKNDENPIFTVNSGDMTQSGNRINEWVDYYDAGRSLFNSTEQMNVIGNNDLTPIDFTVLGDGSEGSKINSNAFLYYYTYEMDEDNLPIIEVSGNTYYIPSLYSFDYNDVHFLCVNSEISASTSTGLFAGQDVYAFIKTWCETDVNKTTKKWKIAVCHEMPFTIITDALITTYNGNNTTERGGSRMNTNVSTANKYWFSQFIENHQFRLCIGGHKHTYSQSYPIRENVSGSTIHSMKPIIQVLDSVYNFVDGSGSTPNKTFFDAKAATNLCEIEVVTGITAPIYVMTQSTGYKQTSNKELPAVNVPWLENYFPSSIVDGTPTPNAGQKYPFYIKWSITSTQIIGDVVKLNNIMTAGKFNINTQNTNPITKLNGNGTSNSQIIINL